MALIQKLPTQFRASRVPTKDKFDWLPFSVLNSSSREWQARVREWEGVFTNAPLGKDPSASYRAMSKTFSKDKNGEVQLVSVFDPYLTELLYKWFSNRGDKVLDPFAGGCTRGIIASALGRNYTGIDISQHQVETNIGQFAEFLSRSPDGMGDCQYILGDSDEELDNLIGPYDFILTCPPYYDLEKYTEDERDLSNLPVYEAFRDKYASILYKATKLLADNSFLAIVVSEIRPQIVGTEYSYYYGFVPDTIRILQKECFLHYYNELILVTPLGSLPSRAPGYFTSTRKIGRQHQNVLIFYKGDIREIGKKFVEIT